MQMLMLKKLIKPSLLIKRLDAVFLYHENFPIKVAEYLREMGHDVLTSQEAGKANQRIPDEDVLKFATETERILITLNRWDFIVLHKQSNRHAGIVVCTQNSDLFQQAQQIDKSVRESGDIKGVLLRVNRK